MLAMSADMASTGIRAGIHVARHACHLAGPPSEPQLKFAASAGTVVTRLSHTHTRLWTIYPLAEILAGLALQGRLRLASDLWS
jgi:hypothetical protein